MRDLTDYEHLKPLPLFVSSDHDTRKWEGAVRLRPTMDEPYLYVGPLAFKPLYIGYGMFIGMDVKEKLLEPYDSGPKEPYFAITAKLEVRGEGAQTFFSESVTADIYDLMEGNTEDIFQRLVNSLLQHKWDAIAKLSMS